MAGSKVPRRAIGEIAANALGQSRPGRIVFSSARIGGEALAGEIGWSVTVKGVS
jgi:hypothetical protein